MWPRIWCVLDQTRQIHKPSNKHQGIDYRFFTGFEMMLTQLNCKVLTSTDPKTHKYIIIYTEDSLLNMRNLHPRGNPRRF